MEIRRKHTELIKAEAKRLGFDGCGISPAGFLEQDAGHLKTWLENGFHGEMRYMENHFEKRTDPCKLVEGAQSIISVILNYHTAQTQADPEAPVISKYAFGRDYHKVIKKRLHKLLGYIHSSIGDTKSRIFVDSAPMLDRAWAAKAGLGWIGKNSNLISSVSGSFIFIGSIVTDLGLAYDSPVNDMCGGCTLCIQSCPTMAIVRPRVLDARKCISYLTIEYKGELPVDLKKRFRNRVFGCDICQDVCPWNRKIPGHQVEDFMPSPALIEMTCDDWKIMDERKYLQLYEGSAVKRAGFAGLRRNIDFLYSRD